LARGLVGFDVLGNLGHRERRPGGLELLGKGQWRPRAKRSRAAKFGGALLGEFEVQQFGKKESGLCPETKVSGTEIRGRFVSAFWARPEIDVGFHLRGKEPGLQR